MGEEVRRPEGPARGGHEEVVFDFSTGEVKVNAPVAAYVPEAGQVHRGADGRYTTGH